MKDLKGQKLFTFYFTYITTHQLALIQFHLTDLHSTLLILQQK